jgi:parvulin-like peptidyl-prolyl isomerase
MAYSKKEEIQPTSTNVMFIDIETVPQFKFYSEMPGRLKDLFDAKFRREMEEIGDRNLAIKDNVKYTEEVQEFYQQKASLHAEFGKIVCISLGITEIKEGVIKLRLKSFAGRFENQILKEAGPFINKAILLCAHAGNNFDFGFTARRFLANKMEIPYILNTMGKKPWECNLIDTMDLWKFTAFNYTCSLDMLAYIFGLPSPKQTVSGSDVYDLFYSPDKTDQLPWEGEEERMKIIETYCEGDVSTLANVYFSMKNLKTIAPENIIRVSENRQKSIEEESAIIPETEKLDAGKDRNA